MRKHVVSTALVLCASGFGCQLFTAGETVSEPEPSRARAARTAWESEGKKAASDPGHEAPSPRENPHGRQAAHGHGHDEAAKAKQEDAPEAPIETATASHVLIRYAGAMRTGSEVTRTKGEAKKLAEDVAKKASRPGADFAALANQYTEDPSGKTRGGKLGTFGRGRMVPEFDKATFELAPGQTSGVVETAFGFHVIHREK